MVCACAWFLSHSLFAQPYTSYLTGDAADVATEVQAGVVLMGGATESDAAMQWFLERSGGGDIVVIRSSGSDGYNNYLYSELGISVNSVETLIIASDEAANDPYVEQQIRNSEALWIAGGDQWNYINYWKDSPVESALQYLISEKGVTIGGTSAGMAVLGQAYFSAENGTITSGNALANPFNTNMTIGYDDFLHVPFLENAITDTHYDSPDRRGRHVAFMARLWASYDETPRGIASEEYTAVCISPDGIGRVFGDYPEEEDYAWFLRANCVEPWEPETCFPGQPLHWQREGEAVLACKVPGTPTGEYTFDLNDWGTTNGGEWQYWSVASGVLSASDAEIFADCLGVGIDNADTPDNQLRVFPNPGAGEYVHFSMPVSGELKDLCGKTVLNVVRADKCDVSAVESGIYLWVIDGRSVRWVKSE
jgi:cyanophycinase-like exopeptidase